jgi:hypothetical protein
MMSDRSNLYSPTASILMEKIIQPKSEAESMKWRLIEDSLSENQRLNLADHERELSAQRVQLLTMIFDEYDKFLDIQFLWIPHLVFIPINLSQKVNFLFWNQFFVASLSPHQPLLRKMRQKSRICIFKNVLIRNKTWNDSFIQKTPLLEIEII